MENIEKNNAAQENQSAQEVNITPENQTGDTGSHTEVQDTAQEGREKSQRLFTQDEVNGFVQNRINRMRGQIEKESKAEYEQKLSDLESRERRLMVKEMLNDRGMPKQLADIITCTDEKDLKMKLDILEQYGKGTNEIKEEGQKTGFFQIDPETGEKKYIRRDHLMIGPGATERKPLAPFDPIRDAMKLNRKE